MGRRLAIMFAILVVFGGVGFMLGRMTTPTHPSDYYGNNSRSYDLAPANYQQETTKSSNRENRRTAITRVASAASPAVVGITVKEVHEYQYQDPFQNFFNDPFFEQFFGKREPRTFKQEVQGLGSGFIISSDGYLLTNDHVAGSANEITVTLTNKKQYKAKLVGSDRVGDIALLKIDGENFPFLKLGDSDDIMVGEDVVAFGNPFGLFDINDKPIVTNGIVSSLGMKLQGDEGRVYRDMIATNAQINKGNSGGPLVNMDGEVIGMNTLIFTGGYTQTYVGYGFAIPINRVKKIIEPLKKNGKIERDFWTGVRVQTIDNRMAKLLGMNSTDGVIVSDVQRNSPGEKAGLQPGDVILEINGTKVVNEESIFEILNDARTGDVVKMKVLRDQKDVTLSLKLEKQKK